MIERIQSALPELQIQSIRSYEEGWDFYVLEVNEEWIFLFPRRPQEIERLKREASFLEQVASDLPVDAPRYEVLHLREPPLSRGYRKLTGTALTTSSCSSTLLRELGQFLSTLHQMNRVLTSHILGRNRVGMVEL
ncbi:hypothetical protein JOD24_002455 [Kroppenstedtia sanguinis]|uniref:phosphotransferase n=1 Tax=Kroppenstedtia sanguinis TaxID=1380684 RepID=UPI003D23744C